MNFKIDPSSGLPIYHQLIEQIKYLIAAGTLQAEDQLPSVRKLSVDLRINPNTIAKAYNIMETSGIVYTRRGEGTFISPQVASSSGESRLQVIRSVVRQVTETAITMKISREDVLKMVNEDFDKLESEGEA